MPIFYRPFSQQGYDSSGVAWCYRLSEVQTSKLGGYDSSGVVSVVVLGVEK